MTDGQVLAPSSLTRIGAIAVGFTGLVAGAVAVTVAAQARHWLGFDFTGVPPRIGQAAAIMLNNGRFALGLVAAAVIAQLRLRHAAAGASSVSNQALTWIARAVGLIVMLSMLANALLVAVAVGAYGERMLVALLPHGPFEVFSYCIGANLFLTARRRPIARGEWVTACVACVGLLAVAAVLETFAWLG
jgi:hypothetical protein